MIVDQSEKKKKRKGWKLKSRDGEGKFTWEWLDFKITALPSVPLVILFLKKEDEFWPTSKLQGSRKLIGIVMVDRARLMLSCVGHESWGAKSLQFKFDAIEWAIQCPLVSKKTMIFLSIHAWTKRNAICSN